MVCPRLGYQAYGLPREAYPRDLTATLGNCTNNVKSCGYARYPPGANHLLVNYIPQQVKLSCSWQNGFISVCTCCLPHSIAQPIII